MRPWLPICIVDWKWTWWGTLLSGGGVWGGRRVSPGQIPGGFPRQAWRVRAARPALQRAEGFRREQIPGRILPVPSGFPGKHAGSGSAPGGAAGGGDAPDRFPADFARSRRIPRQTQRRGCADLLEGIRAEDFRRTDSRTDFVRSRRISPGKHGGVRAAHPAAQRAEGFAGITGTARQQATHPRSTDLKSRQKPIYTAVSAARGTRSIRATSGGLPIRGQDRMHKPRDTISRCPVRS